MQTSSGSLQKCGETIQLHFCTAESTARCTTTGTAKKLYLYKLLGIKGTILYFCMVTDYLLFTLNYEVALLPKIWAVPRAERNFTIQSKQKIVCAHMDHP